ncbi:SMC family ATPase [Propionimicrobium sp. PCR01-08-3]|uniref:AAA family ATPase n=1 Tax=Propionimicrobium sp. PCR01-08-3 TaxID=3052086 RepID=UPI00255CC9B3|nr:SMC family ATPase [Propionimicrobium sp. PCR01-08-3]WIY83495.1 SMC family ATPase [Propionimicrobium sp. PCR01-08-3]
MKIHCVTMTGFGPFRDTETVDFDAFDDDGIFLITGPTGAGKTSILDAVTFALFGSVPRYDGQPGDAVRSDYLAPEQPCSVEVEFGVERRRFKVTRSPSWQRPKLRGDGFTTVPAKAELDELIDGRWERLQSRAVDTARQIADLIRMTGKQFQQVVLLAQGQFQEFLVADTEGRREVLQALFGTKRFSEYERSLTESAGDLKRQLETAQNKLETTIQFFTQEAGLGEDEIPDPSDGGFDAWLAQVVGSYTEALQAAISRRRDLEAALATAKTTYETATDLAQRQSRRADALRQQERLSDQAEKITADRKTLEHAQRADLVSSAMRAFEQARSALDDAAERLADAESAYLDENPALLVTAEELAASIAGLQQLKGRLGPALESEGRIPELQVAADEAVANLDGLDQQTGALKAQRATVSEQIAGLRKKISALEDPAASLADARAKHSEAVSRLRAAEEAGKLAAQLEVARAENEDAIAKAAQASEALSTLRQRQLAGYAADLAQDLSADTPCPVCGSPDHPNPATVAADHVVQEAIDAAQAVVEATYARSKDTDSQVSVLTEKREAKLAEASQLSIAEAKAERDECAQSLDAATAADTSLRRSRADLEAAQTSADDTLARLDRTQSARTALADKRSAALTALTSAQGLVEDARGDQPSVQARMARADHQLDIGQRLLDSITAKKSAEERLDAERTRLASDLAKAGFAEADEAARATRTESDQQVLKARIESYDSNVKAVALTLISPDLQNLPDDPVDVETPKTALDEAEKQYNETHDEVTRARPQVERLQNLSAAIACQRANIADDVKRYESVDRLASTLRGMSPPNTMRMELETFVLAAQLEEIVTIANLRLRTMTDGRYTLQHTDAIEKNRGKWGLGLDVLDAYTGEARAPDSLSGGEKFQASLALALGLADVVTGRAGGMSLDTLFIDEGFGSLDPETLDVTMATLDNLREGGRTVGLISHVPSMKETIPAQLRVQRLPGGWSTIKQGA